jgi:hypothetical protein
LPAASTSRKSRRGTVQTAFSPATAGPKGLLVLSSFLPSVVSSVLHVLSSVVPWLPFPWLPFSLFYLFTFPFHFPSLLAHALLFPVKGHTSDFILFSLGARSSSSRPDLLCSVPRSRTSPLSPSLAVPHSAFASSFLPVISSRSPGSLLRAFPCCEAPLPSAPASASSPLPVGIVRW